MRKKKKEEAKLPKQFYQVSKRFDRWRKSHQPRARFSDELWSEAVAIAQDYGPTRTAKVLGLDYYSLKKHILGTSAANTGNKKSTSSFVELIPPTHTECTIEMEDSKRGKMRISLNGDMPDLISLSRSFWRKEG